MGFGVGTVRTAVSMEVIFMVPPMLQRARRLLSVAHETYAHHPGIVRRGARRVQQGRQRQILRGGRLVDGDPQGRGHRAGERRLDRRPERSQATGEQVASRGRRRPHENARRRTGARVPARERGIYVDPEGSLWLAGNADEDNQILKFTQDGKFLMQIGRAGKSEGSNSRTQLGRPAHMVMDARAQELYVADGYGNKRVVVFDAKSGAYKRHWGAYGAQPSDDKQPPYDPGQPPARQFGNPVHCVRLSNDGKVYVCDRVNNRIQVFEHSGKFVQEFRVEPLTLANGSVWDMVLSHDAAQRNLYVADGANGRIYVLNRADGAQLSSFGRTGRMAGEFKGVHNIAIDRQGN